MPTPVFFRTIGQKMILFIVLLISSRAGAQPVNPKFAAIDKRVRTIQSGSVDTLAQLLTAPYKTQQEQVRSIFRWITENIAYDVVAYNDPSSIPSLVYTPESREADSIVKKNYYDKMAQTALTERKAICEGYARLFKTLCDRAGIRCVVITGRIRWYSDQAGVATNRRHAWNAVYLNDKWQLLDATWASGSVSDDNSRFNKQYDEHYFLTHPVMFLNDHYPDDPKWILYDHPPTREQFYSYPFFYKDFYTSGITHYKPVNGLAEITPANRKIRIEMETSDRNKDLYVEEYPSNDKDLSGEAYYKKYERKYVIEGKKIILDHEISSASVERIEVYYNSRRIMSYTVKRKF